LVAAKTLLHDVAPGTFDVTIYEAQSRIGGLWPLSKHDNAGLVHPLMVANQSRHTVQFSDFAWDDGTPQLPRAWQVGQYLDRYSKRYEGADVRLGHRVVRTELQGSGAWKVDTESDQGTQTVVFDYLLVTTGFFGKPIWPDTVPQSAPFPIVHSSKYRDLPSLLGKGPAPGGKILVVGGQMSGIEIAGTIASHLSSATHSPGEKAIADPDKYSIHHIVQRPAWVFPLFTSARVCRIGLVTILTTLHSISDLI
jgi:cation diffusion facilitator CzcD-associated flavoprotein CzcO